MDLKIHPLEIDPQNPFASDVLNRKPEIENLTTLVLNFNTPTVLAIDSGWGTGKTTFIKLRQYYLKAEGVNALYFNAWETDFSEEPLVAFLGEMNDGLKDLIGDSKKVKHAWETTKSAGKQIAKRMVPAVIKMATYGAVDADKITEDMLANAFGSLSGDALENYLQQKDAIKQFHESFKDFLEKASQNKPLIIFVDELDRCRPDYAIALLERIKHLFNIEGLVFVLALDKKQLGYSISTIYGEGFHSNGYLRRFIDFEYQLQQPDIESYINILFARFKLEEFFDKRKAYRDLENDKDHLLGVFQMIASGLKLSLREIEQIFAQINLSIRTAKKNQYLYPPLLVFLIITKNIKPDVCQRYLVENVDEAECVKFLYEIVPEEKRNNSQFVHYCSLVEGYLISAKSDRSTISDSETYSRHERNLQNDEHYYSSRVIEIAKHLTRKVRINIKSISERIELVSRFEFQSEK